MFFESPYLISNHFIENLANCENQLETVELHQNLPYAFLHLQTDDQKALNKLLSKKQETLRRIILTNLDCFAILAVSYFPKLEYIYMYSSQAYSKFDTNNFAQFVSQSPNLKSIEFNGYFNIDIANEYLYQIIENRDIFVIFSRNLEKKTSRNLLDTKQSSLEEFLRQDPFVHAKYQAMKKQKSTLRESDVTSDTDKTSISMPRDSNPIVARSENPASIGDHVPSFLYLLLALFVFGCYFTLLVGVGRI